MGGEGCEGFVEREEVGVALVDGEGADGEGEVDVVEGVWFAGGVGFGSGGDREGEGHCCCLGVWCEEDAGRVGGSGRGERGEGGRGVGGCAGYGGRADHGI